MDEFQFFKLCTQRPVSSELINYLYRFFAIIHQEV
jgi:hypothetical protein